jgi:hypothetical protein
MISQQAVLWQALHDSLSAITTLEFVQHLFAKLGHRDLLVTHTLRHRRWKCSTYRYA